MKIFHKFSRRFALNAAFLASIVFVAAACSLSPTVTATPAPATHSAAQEIYWPTESWRTSTPEAQGMDGQKLGEMMDAIGQEHLSLHNLLIIRNGYIVSETYFESSQKLLKHELYSVTKSFISTLIGIAVDRGSIDRLDRRVLEYFTNGGFAGVDAQKESLTVEDLLTMRSGLDWHDSDSDFQNLYRSTDWAKFMLELPMEEAPGARFNYCSGCTHLLSAILQKATGMNARAFAEENLFQPLGISDVRWDSDPSGISIGGWGMQLTPRDMAKLGYLYLQNGLWDGRQVVSAQWVKDATRKHTATDGELGYGYQWWTYPSWGAYAALGLYGQTIFVIPESNLLVVTTAGLKDHDPIFRLIEDYIHPTLQTQT